MEDAQSTVETTDAGVTSNGSETPTGSEENSPSLQNGDPQSAEQTAQEMISMQEFNKRVANLRAESERKYQKQLQEKLQEERKQYEGPQAIYQWMNSDPSRAKALIDLMAGQGQASAQQEDPLAEYDPVVANELRKISQFEKFVQQYEQDKQAYAQQIQQQALYQADQAFDSLLVKEGFLAQKTDENGEVYTAATPGNEAVVELIENSVLSIIAKTAANPHQPTAKEVEIATAKAMSAFSAIEKRGVTKTVKQTPHVPVSGSKNGALPNGKSKLSSEDRARILASAMG